MSGRRHSGEAFCRKGRIRVGACEWSMEVATLVRVDVRLPIYHWSGSSGTARAFGRGRKEVGAAGEGMEGEGLLPGRGVYAGSGFRGTGEHLRPAESEPKRSWQQGSSAGECDRGIRGDAVVHVCAIAAPGLGI